MSEETDAFLNALFNKGPSEAKANLVAGATATPKQPDPVAAVRAELEACAEIPHTDARVDTTGRKQPSTKPEPPPPVSFEQALLARRQAKGQAKAEALHHGREPDNRQPLPPIRIHPGGAPLPAKDVRDW